MTSTLIMTPGQEALLPQFRAEWLRWATCTDRADRHMAEAAILALHNRTGPRRSPRLIWGASPAAIAEKAVDTLGPFFRVKWRPLLGDNIRSRMQFRFGISLQRTREFSRANEYAQAIWNSVDNETAVGLRGGLWGQHEIYWLAQYLFARDVMGVTYSRQASIDLDYWRNLAQSCGWWLCFEDVVFVADRPTICHVDEREALHHEHGPAMMFGDGFSVYAWHGTLVPANWIKRRSTLTPDIALTERNVERRRAACEMLGWDHILHLLNARVIDRHPDPLIGELLEVELPDAGKERFLRVLCATGRTFAIPVPPDTQTALAGNAATYGLQPDEFSIEVRT